MTGKTRAKRAEEKAPEFLTVREVMVRLRMSKNAIYEALERGEIPSVRIGRAYRIPAAWLDLKARRGGV